MQQHLIKAACNLKQETESKSLQLQVLFYLVVSKTKQPPSPCQFKVGPQSTSSSPMQRQEHKISFDVPEMLSSQPGSTIGQDGDTIYFEITTEAES